MNKSYWGSICVTDLLAALDEKHSAFIKGNNGKIYCNTSLWINAEEDQFGNSASLQLKPKDVAAKEAKKYIGNFKLNKPKEVAVSNTDVTDIKKQFSSALDSSDLPF